MHAHMLLSVSVEIITCKAHFLVQAQCAAQERLQKNSPFKKYKYHQTDNMYMIKTKLNALTKN